MGRVVSSYVACIATSDGTPGLQADHQYGAVTFSLRFQMMCLLIGKMVKPVDVDVYVWNGIRLTAGEYTRGSRTTLGSLYV